jgi:hypothetical protein
MSTIEDCLGKIRRGASSFIPMMIVVIAKSGVDRAQDPRDRRSRRIESARTRGRGRGLLPLPVPMAVELGDDNDGAVVTRRRILARACRVTTNRGRTAVVPRASTVVQTSSIPNAWSKSAVRLARDSPPGHCPLRCCARDPSPQDRHAERAVDRAGALAWIAKSTRRAACLPEIEVELDQRRLA